MKTSEIVKQHQKELYDADYAKSVEILSRILNGHSHIPPYIESTSLRLAAEENLHKYGVFNDNAIIAHECSPEGQLVIMDDCNGLEVKAVRAAKKHQDLHGVRHPIEKRAIEIKDQISKGIQFPDKYFPPRDAFKMGLKHYLLHKQFHEDIDVVKRALNLGVRIRPKDNRSVMAIDKAEDNFRRYGIRHPNVREGCEILGIKTPYSWQRRDSKKSYPTLKSKTNRSINIMSRGKRNFSLDELRDAEKPAPEPPHYWMSAFGGLYFIKIKGPRPHGIPQ